jgi:hypothetical protein
MTGHTEQMARIRGIDPGLVNAAECQMHNGSAAVIVWTGVRKVQVIIVRQGRAVTALWEDRQAVGRYYHDLPVRWLKRRM